MESKVRELRVRLMSLRNRMDYRLRNWIRYSRPIREDAPIPGIDFRVQTEFKAFLDLFHWEKVLSRFPKEKVLEVADIGARNFCFGPMIDECFHQVGRSAQLYGIELDAFRRLSNLHTRYDYGIFYAKQCRSAEFCAIDFLGWNQPLDVAFLLNPFVTDEPTVYWGLPLSELKPQALFSHAFKVLEPRKGVVVLSTPSIEEFEVALEFAKRAGFKLGAADEEVVWRPQERSQQKKPRYGILLYSELK